MPGIDITELEYVEYGQYNRCYYHNLGDTTCMTRESLADALRWQYDLQHYTVADVLNCGAHV